MVVLGQVANGLIPASGVGTRMMWYPGKAAFRAGSAPGSEWDDASVGTYSWAGGYAATASGQGSAALGYLVTANADYSMAFGYRASTAGRTGARVFGDNSSSDSIVAIANNEFAVRAAGGFRFRSNATLTTGCNLAAGAGAWTCTSSRATKENFADVDGEQVLRRIRATPVTTWNYIDEGRRVRHLGPMAEDFHAAFGLGPDDVSIGMLDIDGVNFAAARALEARTADLRRRLDEKTARVDALEAELAATRRQLADLAARVGRMEQR